MHTGPLELTTHAARLPWGEGERTFEPLDSSKARTTVASLGEKPVTVAPVSEITNTAPLDKTTRGSTGLAAAAIAYMTPPASQLREEFFQQIEGEWVGLRRELIQRGDLSVERRSLFAIFVAIQLMRTLKHLVSIGRIDRPLAGSWG